MSIDPAPVYFNSIHIFNLIFMFIYMYYHNINNICLVWCVCVCVCMHSENTKHRRHHKTECCV